MATKPKPADPEEIRRLDLVARWYLESCPLEENIDGEFRSTLETCHEKWGVDDQGMRQSIFYIRTTFKPLLEATYKAEKEFFDANLMILN